MIFHVSGLTYEINNDLIVLILMIIFLNERSEYFINKKSRA
jgi:hypothetical protein